jgi:methyl-accepting chemotaxis protein
MADALQKKLTHFRLVGEDLERLKQAGAILIPELDNILEAFYDRARATPEAARFFRDQAHMDSARNAQKIHWTRILKGDFDADYQKSVDIISRTHARIQLPIDVFMSSYSMATADLVTTFLTKSRRGFRSAKLGDVRAKVGVLMRAFAMDIEGITAITVELQAEEQTKAFNHINTAVDKLANGDLTHIIPGPEESDFPMRFNAVRKKLNNATAVLGQTLGSVQSSMNQLIIIIDQVTDAASDLSNRTAGQAASLEETAAAVHELTENVAQSTQNTKAAKDVATHAASTASEGSNKVSQASEAMGRIQTSSDKITQIIGLIDDISFQTNLLALNAGVEAARAGAAGRGFAVVAEEVRVLAGNASDAASQIKQLVTASSQEVSSGVDLIEQAAQTLGDIVRNFEKVAGLSTEIAAASQEQSTARSEVNSAITQMDIVTQKNAAMVDETTGAAERMRQLSENVHKLLSSLTLSPSHTSGISAASDLSGESHAA